MMDVFMSVVGVSQGDFKVIYWRELPSWCHEFSPPKGICTSESHEIFSTNISKNCINIKSRWFL